MSTAPLRTATPRSTEPGASVPGAAALRPAASRTAVPAVVAADVGTDRDVDPVLAAAEILLARSEHLAWLTRDAWRWSSAQRRQVLAALDELLERLAVLRARWAAADDDLPPEAG